MSRLRCMGGVGLSHWHSGARGRVRRAFERRSGDGWACSYVTSYRSGFHGDRGYRGKYWIEGDILDLRACCVEAGPGGSSYLTHLFIIQRTRGGQSYLYLCRTANNYHSCHSMTAWARTPLIALLNPFRTETTQCTVSEILGGERNCRHIANEA